MVDQNIVTKIIQASNLKNTDKILEIGPGQGQLTGRIAQEVKEVWAIELDKPLCENLKQNFNFANLTVICQDILKFNFENISSKIKVVGNLPYYISTPIIAHLLQYKDKISAIYISLQKELAHRLVAKPGGKEYGAFSCFVQYHTQPKILFRINRGCFRPIPKVDSAFLELKIRERPAVAVKDEERFFKIIHIAFNQRRKTIKNTLSQLAPKEDLIRLLAGCQINPISRPEQLSLEDFARIYQSLS